MIYCILLIVFLAAVAAFYGFGGAPFAIAAASRILFYLLVLVLISMLVVGLCTPYENRHQNTDSDEMIIIDDSEKPTGTKKLCC
ncbi:MAG: DUF1328 domain-containing protein [Chitinispirillaceae bacterium]